MTTSTRIITRGAELREAITRVQQSGESVGMIPTMGSLHAGHLSLVDTSMAECDRTVVTIFVNPTQFGPREDYDEYPRTMEKDLAMLRERGCWLVFAPTVEEMYPAGHETIVDVGSISKPLEGAARPKHFFGVATVVLKLLNLAPVDRAYFGQKDYQQTLVVRKLVSDLNVPTDIRVCPIVRESDGLAMSSRNAYITPEQRRQARVLSQALFAAQKEADAGQVDAGKLREQIVQQLQAADEVEVEYVSLVARGTVDEVSRIDGPTVIVLAARVGSTRLIDNCQIG
jgi:pantoate--beta-alanine ligase